MKNLRLSVLFTLLSFNAVMAQIIQSTGAGTSLTVAYITVTAPAEAAKVYQGSFTRCTWTHTNDLAFGTRVSVMLLTRSQKTDLIAKMQRHGNNNVPLDSIQNVLGIASADVNSGCDWYVSATQAPGDYAIVVRHSSGKLGVGPLFTVHALPSAPNIVSYTPHDKGSVFGGKITFTGREIIPEAVQVFLGDNKLDIVSATSGQVVALITGTKKGALKIGHGSPSNTIVLNHISSGFRPVGQPMISDIQPRTFTKGTIITITGKDLDSVEFRNNTLSKVNQGVLNVTNFVTPNIFYGTGNTFSIFAALNEQDVEIYKSEYAKKRAEIIALIKKNGGGRDNFTLPVITNYYLTGPKIVKFGNYLPSFDGSKITFVVENVYQTYETINTSSNYFELHSFPLDSQTVKPKWKFSLKNGADSLHTVVMPLIAPVWNAPLPPPPPPPPPAFEIKAVITNSLPLTASNNFVIVAPNILVSGTDVAVFLLVKGKSLENAVAKLGTKTLYSRIKKNGNVIERDAEGYETLEVGISFTATSDFLEFSKSGRVIRFPQKLIIAPRPHTTTTPLRLLKAVNTDITITGFDLLPPPEAVNMSYDWKLSSPEWINNRCGGFTFQAISSTKNAFTFRINMPAGTPTSRMINGQNVSFFGSGENALKLNLQLEGSAFGASTVYSRYEFEFTQ